MFPSVVCADCQAYNVRHCNSAHADKEKVWNNVAKVGLAVNFLGNLKKRKLWTTGGFCRTALAVIGVFSVNVVGLQSLVPGACLVVCPLSILAGLRRLVRST